MTFSQERWRFLDPENEADRRRRATTEAAIDAWWEAFRENTAVIAAVFAGDQKLDLPAFMEEHLGAVHPELMWEFGRGVRQEGRRLVITPESRHDLRPLLDTVLARAPRIEGWELYDHRIPEDLELTRATVEGRVGSPLAATHVRIGAPDEERLFSLTFLGSSIAGPDDGDAARQAFVAAETLLGERTLDRWIGSIDVDRLSAKGAALARWFGKMDELPADAIPLEALEATLATRIAGITAGLPAEPCVRWIASATWQVLRVQTAEAEDYAEQGDLLFARTIDPDRWRAAHGRNYSDERFTRCGETLAYVKLEGGERLGEAGFAERAAIEDALDAALLEPGLGCIVGGGTGRRYSYIDLALTDVERAIPIIQGVLRSAKVPRRSWILFFDATLSGEWVGIHPDSPPPPTRPQ